MKNFTRPKGEKPFYYSSTVENGKVIYHEGEKNHAVYKSEMDEIEKRANRWHKWIEKNYKNAYSSAGVIKEAIYTKNIAINKQFMDGLRNN